jgi:CIC family chloride channel protein
MSIIITRLLIATAVGVLTGVVVIGVEHLVEEILHEVEKAEPWVIAAVLTAGALLAALLAYFLGGRSSSTTETYVEKFHEEDPPLEPTHAPGRLAASVASLGSGAPLGMEGPAVYSGAVIATVFRRFSWARLIKPNALLAAGAAAGVAAVFKAPVAGAVFALEVPFRDRMAGERILPALFGSAAGYLTLTALEGTEPELGIPAVEVTFGRAMGSLLLGAVVGLVARGIIELIRLAERYSTRGLPWVRGLAAGLTLAGLFVLGRGLTGENVAITSGFPVVDWALEPDHGIWLLVAVLLIRSLGTSVAVGGGGAGGLFVPLIATGAIVGRIFADVGNTEELTLFVMVGGATMLGAGYAAPLTGVIIIAELTGQPGVIVPSLLATTIAMLTVGNRSVSHAQRSGSPPGDSELGERGMSTTET